MDIADWRRKIDDLDRELVRLLNERARCAAQIGQLKRQNGLPIREPSREREVLAQVVAANQGPLDNQAIERLFQQIVAEGRALQQRLFTKQGVVSNQK